jgi:hypothetical protein
MSFSARSYFAASERPDGAIPHALAIDLPLQHSTQVGITLQLLDPTGIVGIRTRRTVHQRQTMTARSTAPAVSRAISAGGQLFGSSPSRHAPVRAPCSTRAVHKAYG